MKYILQGYTGKIGLWKYLIIPAIFFGLMGLNFLAIVVLDLDVEHIIQQEIAKKGKNRFLIESLFPFAIGLAILMLWVKYVHQQSITALTTSRKKVDWKRVIFSFGLWTVLTIVLLGIDYVVSPENYEWNFEFMPFVTLAAIAIVLIPIQTSFEEYFFRGYLMQGLGIAIGNKWIPLFLTSVVFGLLHLGNPEVAKLGNLSMVYYIGTGFFLGIVTLMDEGLELALGFHAANNLITALLVTADWTAFQTHSVFKDVSDPVLGFDVFIPIFVIFPIVLFVFSKKYGWSNWKDSLFGSVETLGNNEQ